VYTLKKGGGNQTKPPTIPFLNDIWFSFTLEMYHFTCWCVSNHHTTWAMCNF